MDEYEAGHYFAEIIDRIQYKSDWRKILKLDGKRWYFQWEWTGIDNTTGESGYVASSAKYYLSPHMKETEVVNKVFLAAKLAEEHECREIFQYRPTKEDEWRTPYNTHTDIIELWTASFFKDER